MRTQQYQELEGWKKGQIFFFSKLPLRSLNALWTEVATCLTGSLLGLTEVTLLHLVVNEKLIPPCFPQINSGYIGKVI